MGVIEIVGTVSGAVDMASSRKPEEVLGYLAIKLMASAHQLNEVARRLQLVEPTYRESFGQLRKLDEQIRRLISLLQGANEAFEPVAESGPTFSEPPSPPKRKLRHSDYIEFSNYAELRKFQKLGNITDKEVQKFDAEHIERAFDVGKCHKQRR